MIIWSKEAKYCQQIYDTFDALWAAGDYKLACYANLVAGRLWQRLSQYEQDAIIDEEHRENKKYLDYLTNRSDDE